MISTPAGWMVDDAFAARLRLAGSLQAGLDALDRRIDKVIRAWQLEPGKQLFGGTESIV